MKSEPLGVSTSGVEVTNVSRHGIWMLAGSRELFMSFKDFPWFRDASIGRITNVEEPSPGHFPWPDLDIDIGLRTIEHPDDFPLVGKGAVPTPHPQMNKPNTS